MDLVKYSRSNSFLKIKGWYLTDGNDDIPDDKKIILSEKETKHKNRLEHIWSLRYKDKYLRTDVIRIAMRDHKISQATAYRDYMLSQQLFGELDQVNIAAERMILAQRYWDISLKCEKKGDEDGARKALDSYKSLFPWQETDQVVDPKKLEASVYRMVLPRGVGKVINAMFESGVADFNSLGAEDVDFKEVEETEEEPDDE